MNKLTIGFVALLLLNCSGGNTQPITNECSWSENVHDVNDRNGWCSQVTELIKQQRSYKRVKKELTNHLRANRKMSCRLVVTKNGAISLLEICESSGSEKLDRQVLALVRSTAPFGNPPEGTAFRRNLLIEFKNANTSLEPVISYSRLINGRIGEYQ